MSVMKHLDELGKPFWTVGDFFLASFDTEVSWSFEFTMLSIRDIVGYPKETGVYALVAKVIEEEFYPKAKTHVHTEEEKKAYWKFLGLDYSNGKLFYGKNKKNSIKVEI